jgi:ADP-ribose pyrophosphatase YjhB (NUDIX family)
MRPPKVDSNAYSYHLRMLQKEGLVDKTEHGYNLAPAGLFYVDRVSMTNLEPRAQPKIITMIVVKNREGDILLYSKLRQPFIGSWVLPFGKVHLDDTNIDTAATRELSEKAGIDLVDVNHRGDCYIYAKVQGQIVSSVMAHIFTATLDNGTVNTEKHAVKWMDKAERSKLQLGPAVHAVIAETEKDQAFFFKTFDVDWID